MHYTFLSPLVVSLSVALPFSIQVFCIPAHLPIDPKIALLPPLCTASVGTEKFKRISR
jgi:hypothetical protein